MCKSRGFNIIAILIGILVASGFTALAFLGLVIPLGVGVKIALIVAALVVGAAAFATTSLLSQDSKIDACICRRARNALVAGILSIIIGTFAFLYTGTSIVVFYSLIFLLAFLFVYGLLAVGCLYSCIISTRSHHRS